MKHLIFLVILIWSNFATAQNYRALTVEDCVKLGIENSESLHSALMKVEAAEAKIGEQKANRLPFLKFNGAYARLSDERDFILDMELPPPIQMPTVQVMDDVLNNYQFGLTLQQPVFTGFRLSNALRMAEYNAEAQNQNYEAQRNELIYLIKSTYWNLYKAVELKKVVDENVEQVKAHLKDIKNMFEQGLITNNEVLKVEVRLSNAQFLQIESETALKQAMMYLCSIIGLPLDTQIHLQSDISSDTEEIGNIDELVQLAIDNRPELKSVKAQINSVKAVVKTVQSAYYPQVYLQGNYNYSRPNQRIMPIKDKFEDSWRVSLALSYDIWNWRKTHYQVKQAKAKVSQAEDNFTQMKDGIELEVNSIYLNLVNAKKEIAVAEEGIKQADENYRITKERFKMGMALNSDLLDAEAALLKAKTTKTAALVNYKIEKAKLEKAIGNTK